MTYELPEELTVEDDGPVRTVVISRPAALNAVNLAQHWALANVWRQLAADRAAHRRRLAGRYR